MTDYSVHQLAVAAGITVRTLHHYDAIGLLSPGRVEGNGYRRYTAADLLRLQQIMFYRELDFPLDKIKSILDAPGFDNREALVAHRRVLLASAKRLNGLVKTIDATISSLDKGVDMAAGDLYGTFTKKQMEEYQKEAEERWGKTDAYKQSTANVAKMGKAGLAQVAAENKAVEKELAAVMDRDVRDPAVQALVARHRANIAKFYTVSDEMYRGLAEMYLADPRFTAHYDGTAPGLADFLSRAMHASLR